MASIKDLKKDIHFLAYELASETMFKMVLHSNLNGDTLNQIVLDGVALRDELIRRSNHRDAKNNPALVKEYYRNLRKEMMSGYNKLFEQLDELK
ncbi:MAG: hypothetical protein QM786_02045 [Breznakibacter sp.]